MNKFSKLRLKLAKTRNGAADVETQIYSDIFDLDDKIKEKEKEIEILRRSLKLQDSAMKKHFKHAYSGSEATELEKAIRQNDSLHKQLRCAQNQSKDAINECDKLKMRRVNM